MFYLATKEKKLLRSMKMYRSIVLLALASLTSCTGIGSCPGNTEEVEKTLDKNIEVIESQKGSVAKNSPAPLLDNVTRS